MDESTAEQSGGLRQLPVIGPVLNFVAPKRRGRLPAWRRAVSWGSGVVIVVVELMMPYPSAGPHYPGISRGPVEKGIEWSNIRSDTESNRIQDRLATRIKSKNLENKLRSGA